MCLPHTQVVLTAHHYQNIISTGSPCFGFFKCTLLRYSLKRIFLQSLKANFWLFRLALSKTDFCILYFCVGIFVFGTNFDFFGRNFIISVYFFHFLGFLWCDQILYFWGNDEILYFWHSDEILHFWGNDEILHFWEFRKFCYFDTKNLNFVSKKLKIRIQKK